ncbi:hypothetical protein GGI12_002564 [Dipsacomyces acuminosporus]|nr:hypothetical protein GGI12_002564 [Dipsacomyces acuminosporus]
MPEIKRTMTVSSTVSVQDVEDRISTLVGQYSSFDTQVMFSSFSDDYCKEADSLLRDLNDALSSPSAAAIHKAHGDGLEVVGMSHLGHTQFSDNTGQIYRNSKRYSLSDHIANCVAAFDMLDAEYSKLTPRPKMLLCGHSVGCYIAEKIIESRHDRIDRVFSLFPTVEHIADTPRGHQLQMLFRPYARKCISGLVEGLTWILPASALYSLGSLSGSLNADSSKVGAPVNEKTHILNPQNFGLKTNTGTWFVKHYSPTCGHCQNFQPKWEKVIADNSVKLSEKSVHFGELNCLEYTDLCSHNKVESWPTVVVFTNGARTSELVGDKSEKDFADFVKRTTGTDTAKDSTDKSKAAAAQRSYTMSSVVLDAHNFTTHAGQGLWLIKHYSPTCPHCRHMAPAWTKLTDELAKQLAGSQIFFGEVNCPANRELCDINKVEGYPTITLFSNGNYIEEMTLTPTYEEMRPYALKLAKRRDSGEFDKPPEAAVANDNRDWDDDSAPAADKKQDAKPAKATAATDAQLIEKPAVSGSGAEKKKSNNVEVIAENKRSEVYNEDGEVVVLTKDNFAEKTSTGPWFVKFYAPWCPHCQHLAPIWEKLAAATRGKINVAKVNCDEHSTVCSKYNVQGYPTLKVLWEGETVDYKGERQLESFKSFIDTALAKPRHITDAREVQSALKEHDVVFVFAYDKADTTAKTRLALSRVSSNAQKMFLSKNLNIISDVGVARAVITGQGPKLPALVAFKDNQMVKYDGSLTNDDQLHEWYYAERFPLLPQLDRENSDDLFYDSDYLVLAVLDTDRGNDYMTHYRDAVRSAAIEYQKVYEAAGKKQKGAVRFAWVDGNKWASYIDRVFHIQRTEWPAIVIAQPSEDQFFRHDIKGGVIEPTKMGIFMAVRAALGGKLKAQSTSSIIVRGVRGIASAVKSVWGFFFGSFIRTLLSLAAAGAVGYHLYKRSKRSRSGSYSAVKTD